MFDESAVEYLNVERPETIPLNPGGKSYPVIARFILPDSSEEWRPSTVARWTSTHVMVGYQAAEGERRYVWLRADDVKRVIRRPAPGQNESPAVPS